ncbi:MAG: FHA domain-containing protein [Acidobacteriota bacterium]
MTSSAESPGEANPARREATNYFMQARSALKNGEVNTAEKLLRRALTLWPDNYNYLLQLAKLFIQVGKDEGEIEQLLRQSSSLNLLATEPRLLLATQYEKLGQLEKAVAIYKGVLNIDPDNLIVRRRFRQLEIELGPGMSLATLSAHIPAGQIELATEPIAAVPALQPALPEEKTPEPQQKTYTVEVTEYVTGALSKSVTDPMNETMIDIPTLLPIDSLPSVEKERPAQEEPKVLGSKELANQSDNAWNALLESIHHDSEMFEVDGSMPLNVGISYMEMGFYQDAIEELQQAYQLYAKKEDPEQKRCCRLLVDCYLALEQYQQAAEWSERALTLCSRNSEEGLALIHELVNIYERLGDRSTVAKLVSELSASAPDYLDDAAAHTTSENPVLATRFALRPLRGVNSTDLLLDHKQGEITIGRGPQNNIQIGSARISKKHALLRFTDNGIFLVNFSHTNGTFLNGNRLEIDREYRLEIGDQIGLGRSIELQLIEIDVPV